MTIAKLEKIFSKEGTYLNFSKQLWDEFFVDIGVHILADKFVEYQKSLVEEFVADLINFYEWEEDITFYDIKEFFESSLKSLNHKLTLFADKVKEADKFEIRWFAQVVYEDNYLASLIGDVSVIIFRERKLNSIIPNEIDPSRKIDLFSEVIEGNIENGDQVVFVGLNILNYLSKDELVEAVNISFSTGESFLDLIEDLLGQKIEKDKIHFIYYFEFNFPIASKNIVSSKQLKFKLPLKFLEAIKIDPSALKRFVIENKYSVIFALLLGVVFLFIYAVYHVNVTIQKGVNYSSNITIDKIKQQINDFVNTADLSKEARKDLYNKILNELNQLEQRGLYVKDVEKLKNDLEIAYYDVYKISVIATLEWGWIQPLYKFDEDVADLVKNAFYVSNEKNGIWIAYSSWVIAGILPDLQPTIISGLPGDETLKKCVSQPNNNGVVCVSNKNNFYSFANGTYSLVGINGISIDYPIGGIDTYLKKYFYTMREHLGEDNASLIDKFKMKDVGALQELTYQTTYKIVNPDKFVDVAKDGFADMYIDGNFLAWSKALKEVVLMWRNDPLSDNLQWKVLSKVWGDEEIIDKLSQQVTLKGFYDQATQSKYVVLFDPTSEIVVIYREKGQLDRMELVYQGALLFKAQEKVKTIGVSEEGENIRLYIVTTQGVYRADLKDFIEW